MLKAILIVSQQGQATREVESGESVTHIGSALDNTVCLEPDAGIECYHAVVERRGDDYWLTNLSTRQGTKVNDQPVVAERQLADGDRIMLGAACLIEFYRSEAGYAASSATFMASSAVASNISSTSAARPAGINRAGERVWVLDEGSTGGTFVKHRGLINSLRRTHVI